MNREPHVPGDAETSPAADAAPDVTTSASLRRRVRDVFSVNVIGLAVVAGATWVMARLLGTAGFGAFQFGFAWVDVLALLATLGLDKLAIREISVHEADSARGDASARARLRGFLHFADRTSLASSLALALVAGSVVWMLADRLDARLFPCFWVLLLLTPIRTWMYLRHGALLGFHESVRAQVPLLVLQPLLTVGFVVLAATVFADAGGPGGAAIGAVLAGMIGLGVSQRWLRRGLARRGATSGNRAYRTGPWMAAALPMMLTAGMSVINIRADVIMVGSLIDASAAGIYGVAAQIALLGRFGLMAVNPALAPIVARLHAGGDRVALQQRASLGARTAFLVAVAVMVGVALAGRPVLGLFGDGFVEGHHALVLLAAFHLVGVAFGASEVLLMMTGHQVTVTTTVAVATATNLILNAVLIPRYGLDGAAIATGSSMLLWSVSLAVGSRRWLGVDPTILGRGPRPGETTPS